MGAMDIKNRKIMNEDKINRIMLALVIALECLGFFALLYGFFACSREAAVSGLCVCAGVCFLAWYLYDKEGEP